MGVSGSGKTTIGLQLSKNTGFPFYDADDFHPKANVDKMASGHPLNDDDRKPWLQLLKDHFDKNKDKDIILACSALKEKYRTFLSEGNYSVQWIYLKGSFETIHMRMKMRAQHYMPAELLQSQFDALEAPSYGWHINIENPIPEINKQLVSKIKNNIMLTDFGVIGLGVMGKSISLNIADHNTTLSVYNRAAEGEEKVVDDFLKQTVSDHQILGFTDLKSFVDSIKQPRKILMMIKAGPVVDIVINNIIPFLGSGDMLIDGGNSHYEDTIRREKLFQEKNLNFVGAGVSGGEEGARKGPSIMVGGNPDAYKLLSPILEPIAARSFDGKSCCGYVGENGAGHFVKMVHNGIEYVEMQLLAELYQLLKANYSYSEIADIFEKWNDGELSSYLLEITIDILRHQTDGQPTLDIILDKAGNKGTGSWSVKAGFDVGTVNTMMSAAVFARYISTFKSLRQNIASKFNNSTPTNSSINLSQLQSAYQIARILNHMQGFDLIANAAKKYNWQIDLSNLARIWTNGCIIRSTLMENCVRYFNNTATLFDNSDLLTQVNENLPYLKMLIKNGIDMEFSMPAFNAAFNYWCALKSAHLPANLIQAQRDYFGAHTYRRNDKPENEIYHTLWTTT